MNGAGKLFGVGVGPGDPELMTLKAARRLRSCDIVAIPQTDRDRCVALRIAVGAVPEIAQKPILALDMPMTRDSMAREQAYDAAARQLTSLLAAGKTVAFLTLGDPAIYSTYGYLHRRVTDAGYAAEFIPGVPSFCAAAAALGEPLCLGEEPLHILPRDTVDDGSGTRIYMKGGARQVRRLRKDRDGRVLAAVNVGMEGERLYRSLEDIPEDTGYFTLIIAKEN